MPPKKRNVGKLVLDVRLQKKQRLLYDAVKAGIRYPFYGGARGGGKSYASRMIMILRRLENPGSTGLLLRRTFKQLNGNHIIPLLMQFPKLKNWYNKSEQAVFFPTTPESVLFFGHCEHEQDVFQYQGQEFDDIAVEEVTQFTEFQYEQLKTSLRTSNPSIEPCMWATGNPGGIGHLWVKNIWIDKQVPKGDEKKYLYIPAKVYDNQALMSADPEYENTLLNIKDPMLRRAYLMGDWDVYPGQFFYMWRKEDIEVKSFPIPRSWTVFGAIDYGESNPCSYGQYAVDYDGVIYRLWGYYQQNRSASEHAQALKRAITTCPYTGGRGPDQIFADPSMWTKRRLHENYAKSPTDVFAEHSVYLTRANNDRPSGWSRCKDILVHGKFKTFEGHNDDFMRTVPSLPRDDKNWEDINTHTEDHAGDEWRYGMSHMWRPADSDMNLKTGSAGEMIEEMVSEMLEGSGRYDVPDAAISSPLAWTTESKHD
tara:strand:- start:243 stop:1688 length:1446 start_codon:yes stop_codon:yes gene_type:complete